MIKASYLQQQATKYRKLARTEDSLEMRRQLFALAARCDEVAVGMARAPERRLVAKLMIVKTTEPAPPAPSPAAAPSPTAPGLPFAGHARARLVHRFAE
jgi:hypothetical protein